MANREHLKIMKQGVEAWNKWRKENPDIKPNLVGADLNGADLDEANLSEADLRGAYLRAASLTKANLRGANLSGAMLYRANLYRASLIGADLSGASLHAATLIETKLLNTNLTGCKIYGISAWDLNLENSIQKDIIISKYGDPVITVDNLEVAQFINLLLNNAKIRDVIDTITSKVVLILGRFAPKQKAVLDAIREELRQRNYLPIVFDFTKPASRDLTETISTLAHMARFVIADLTNAKSLPQELTAIIPDLPSVPVQPIIQSGKRGYAMFERWRRYPWVLQEYAYPSSDDLIAVIEEKIIHPAEKKVEELRQ